jgi:type II secretory pathway component PulF
VASALRWIADQADQGRSLEDTLAHSGKLLPTYVSGLILAAARTGRLGEALFELGEQQQSLRAVRYSIRQGFVYSRLVLALAISVLLFIVGYVTSSFKQMFDEFELRLPTMTAWLFWWHDHGLRIAGCVILAILVLAVLLRIVAGRARWQRLMSTLPLFGTLWRSLGMAEWAGLMSVLLKHEIPLPSALRLAGHGIRNAHIGQVSLRLADGVARGRSLSQLMYAYRELPSTLIPLVEWGERSGGLSESFRVGREMLEKRAAVRGTLIIAIVSPVLFVSIAAAVMFVVVALFMPLIDLISKLSS